MRLIGSVIFILLGIGLVFAGLGINGKLEELGIDPNGMFTNITDDQLAGWGAAGAGAVSLLFGALLLARSSSEHT